MASLSLICSGSPRGAPFRVGLLALAVLLSGHAQGCGRKAAPPVVSSPGEPAPQYPEGVVVAEDGPIAIPERSDAREAASGTEAARDDSGSARPESVEGAGAVVAGSEGDEVPEDEGLAQRRDGFRVQIYAGRSLERAEEVADQARAALELAVYVVATPEFFKVRVGDCLTRDEAELLVRKVRAAGYGDAWIVESLVAAP